MQWFPTEDIRQQYTHRLGLLQDGDVGVFPEGEELLAASDATIMGSDHDRPEDARTTARGRRLEWAQLMSPLEVLFDGPGMLVMRTDLSANWGMVGHSYGFSVQHKIEYRSGWSIRAQLTFRASPPGAGRAASLFPGAVVAGGDQLVGWTIKDSVITFRVALKFEQPWRIMSTGRPGLYFEAGPLLRGADGSRLHVQGLLVFHEPDPAPIPDVHVWSEKMFVSGGLFESNRRRH